MSATKIFALGGIEEIGKNCYVIEHEEEIWIIDCGIKFVNEQVHLGFNSIIVPFDYLEKNVNKIQGLIVTHAHEDHIGGIPYLLKTLPIKTIYAGKLAKGIIENKFREHKDVKAYTFQNIDDDTVIKSKHFSIDFFRVSHSVPDAFGVAFQTPNGIIVTTGDFRFDFQVNGDESDIWKMAEIGKRGVDVLLCESTNSAQPGFNLSEKFVYDELERIISNAKGRVFLTTFATQLDRIAEVIKIAYKYGRKTVLGGRSMINNVEIYRNLGLLPLKQDNFLELREMGGYRDEELFITVTGSQGQELSALGQMANGTHNWVQLKPSDTIIFSSSPIPGNFEPVEKLINKLYKTGCTVIINTPEQRIHASGHAAQTEAQLLVKLINPNYVIPIHGEYKQMVANKSNDEAIGIPNDHILIIRNGERVELNDHVAKISDEVEDIYNVFVDGNKINKDSSSILKYRQILSSDGVINITVWVNKQQKRLVNLPVFSTRGSFYAKTANQLITKIVYSIKETLEAEMNKKSAPISDEEIKSQVESLTNFYIWKNKRKKPLIVTSIFNQ